MFQCFNCAAPLESTLRQPAVKETCGQCGAYLHCCRNCQFHRKGYPNACYIPDTEKIADKTRANFCDEFEFRPAGTNVAEKSAAQDKFLGLWGEEAGTSIGDRDSTGVEDWLLRPEKKPTDLSDLFES